MTFNIEENSIKFSILCHRPLFLSCIEEAELSVYFRLPEAIIDPEIAELQFFIWNKSVQTLIHNMIISSDWFHYSHVCCFCKYLWWAFAYIKLIKNSCEVALNDSLHHVYYLWGFYRQSWSLINVFLLYFLKCQVSITPE